MHRHLLSLVALVVVSVFSVVVLLRLGLVSTRVVDLHVLLVVPVSVVVISVVLFLVSVVLVIPPRLLLAVFRHDFNFSIEVLVVSRQLLVVFFVQEAQDHVIGVHKHGRLLSSRSFFLFGLYLLRGRLYFFLDFDLGGLNSLHDWLGLLGLLLLLLLSFQGLFLLFLFLLFLLLLSLQLLLLIPLPKTGRHFGHLLLLGGLTDGALSDIHWGSQGSSGVQRSVRLCQRVVHWRLV